MPNTAELYIGLMSGTSIDSIDAILADFSQTTPIIVAHRETEISSALRAEILALSTPGEDHIDRLGHCDTALGRLFAQATNDLLAQTDITHNQVRAIGSHGQTIRHRPPQTGVENPFTLQIGDPNIIAATTNITTVADFRRRDLALGGQGAPLVPAFHEDAFHSVTSDRAILNVGGIANVTWVPTSGEAYGFDTGPGNMLMDSWCQKHQQKPYDDNGVWAASGNVQLELLKRLLKHPFLAKTAPKSTGREDFNIDWLERVISSVSNSLATQDVQATLLEFTARTVADAIKNLGKHNKEVYVCGGGAFNGRFMKRLQELLNNDKVVTTSALGVDPKHVEGLAFAWLAKRTLQKLSGNMPSTTGASKETILGGVYFSS
jgi:anhydro-N-acetylmuramic acid kinase